MTTCNVILPDTFSGFHVKLPDNFAGFHIKMPEIGIDPQKVLLIVNSDVPLSGTMADYYETARGLNAAHRITKALGTDDTTVGGTDGADQATFYTNVVLPVANYIEANAIEAVILSARVPHLVWTVDDGHSGKMPTSAILGAAVYIRDEEGGMVRMQSVNACIPQYATVEDASNWFHAPVDVAYGSSINKEANNKFLDFRIPPSPRDRSIPHGRLGLPKFDAAVPAETQAETERMIDDALAREGIGPGGGEIHFGLHDRVISNGLITGLQGEHARQAAALAGVTAKHYIGTYSADWPAAPAASYDRATMLAGSLDETAFGMIGSAIINEPIGAPYINSYTWVQGSWGFEATSNGYSFMANMLMNGACSAVGTVLEPYAEGPPKLDTFTLGILAGRSLCEAMLMGGVKVPWMQDCWGDPLYAPFKRP